MKIKIALTLIVLFLVSFGGYPNVKNLGEGTNEKGKTAVNQEAVSAVNSLEKDALRGYP